MTEALPDDKAAELREMLGSVRFVFARTLSHIPHWYMRRADDEVAFQVLRKAIKQYGVRGEFGGHSYRYLYLDTWKYWEIPPVPVINRANITHDWNTMGFCRRCAALPDEHEQPCRPLREEADASQGDFAG